MYLEYVIDNKIITLEAPDDTEFFSGKNICLSDVNDVIKSTYWYKRGYVVKKFPNSISFKKIKKSITDSLRNIILDNYPRLDLNGFNLEKYHKFISSEKHLKLDKFYKRLYPKDFGFNDESIVDFISGVVGRKLSYKDKFKDLSHWIIVRVNMPASSGTFGFNPAHKDIYEDYDERNYIPKMVNTWIPICGVNSNTGLPLAIGSHLYKESELVRTKSGSFLQNQKYSVNSIRSWGGHNELKLISPKDGEILIFSSHLIHGLGINNNSDTTRVSLEFRLHEI